MKIRVKRIKDTIQNSTTVKLRMHLISWFQCQKNKKSMSKHQKGNSTSSKTHNFSIEEFISNELLGYT